MKLNHWVLIGLWASIIWAVGSAVYSHNSDVARANHSAAFAYNVCKYGKEVDHDKDLSSCLAEREKSVETSMSVSNWMAAFVALAPLPFAWLTVFILRYVVRAQIVGFRAVIPWKSLPTRKKRFAALCMIFCLALLGFGVLWGLNLYVDLQVPVGMTPFLDMNQYGDNVEVSGTWTRTDRMGDSSIADPLQTSKIECQKDQNRCTEALASVGGNTLMADLVDYDIQSWTPDAIVMRREFDCTSELFTIDLNTKAVTGAGHKINQDTPRCRMNTDDEAGWTYHLVKGFDVYWEMRRNARPLPLRVIQSVFGN